MSKLPIPFVQVSFPLFLLLLIALPFEVISQDANTEQTILLDLKDQLGNPSALQWNSSTSPCSWPEITCTDGTVTELSLRNINITVPIPARICDLKNLTVVDLAYNYIPGGFPKVFYNCSKLQYLDLSQNYFVGPIPDDIDRLSKLQYIDLGANNFTGNIPPSIGNLPELQKLFLYQNQFNGTFPKEIGNLANLEELGMAINGFVPSPIPVEFSRLKKLKYLWMASANLIGQIPESFSSLTTLEHLDLALNHLEGNIPAVFFTFKNLSGLYLQNNRFQGEIPQLVEALNLVELELGMNNLTGTIPKDIGKLQKLELFSVFGNKLSGEVPPSLGLLPALKTFKLFDNNFSGVLPPEMGLHSRLEEFDIATNQFTGQLPANLCAGGALEGLVVFENNISGEVPQSLGNCRSLRTVQLYKNNFSGEIPSGFWTATNITSLRLHYNSFSGTLPETVAWNLTRLEIGNNKISGSIPKGISKWGNLVVLEASNNLLSGEIPVELTSLSRLDTLSLDGNQLSGQLPSQIISWNSLTALNLSRNGLSGQIPVEFGSLPDLNYLDLSNNHFSGQIPSELGKLTLNSLNLSSNQLYGQIPRQFDNLAYENSFLNNSRLCAVNTNLNLPKCYAKMDESSKLATRFLALILVATITVFLVTVVCTFLAIRDYRRKKQKRDLATWKLTSFHRLDFTAANILHYLTENNLIGSGGSGKVYRIPVNVNGGGGFVAVKRIWNNRNRDYTLEKAFLAEVEILGTIRHANIVKLLCCISSEDSKLLVYEYMVNHSLDGWLHGKKRKSLSAATAVLHVGLDWPARLQIAIGAAQGLCYMHHDCSPPIIHRDVKSSNILLDSEFKARIADFGLAKMLARQGESHTMSAVAGSFGYIAPEYAYSTKVNEKIDVYSFGVVLLELVTGREANCGDEHTSLAEWAWKHSGEGKAFTECLDEEIKQPCYLQEMIDVFKLGLMCTNTLPSSRPSMKDVLQVLHKCCPESKKKTGNEFDFAPLLGGTATYLSSYRKSKKVADDVQDGTLVYSV
ncbi:hypothetical protein Tsubulata_036594 [Turnera subulata]|uniref:Protein kinase domain-containing protein n=1 Tax=Turnera subulata TaxID=218843 RepID=A0A9Q0GL17_9ROSI|nr:hypothetical protein Tsubulata_036594 [Turnera subulata]